MREDYDPPPFRDRLFEAVGGMALAVEDMYLTYLMEQINTAERQRPIIGSLEEYLIFNSGNLFNGYFMALFTNAVIGISLDVHSLVSEHTKRPNVLHNKFLDYLAADERRITLLSGLVSCSAITFFETTGVANTPDLKDIPAGFVGAGLYMGVRWFTTKTFTENVR